jgi:hypothetical protein
VAAAAGGWRPDTDNGRRATSAAGELAGSSGVRRSTTVVGQLGQGAGVGGEQDEVADGEVAAVHGRGGQQQHQPDAEVHGGAVEGAEELGEELVAEGGTAAVLVQGGAAAQHRLDGVGGLDRQRGPEDLPEEAADGRGGGPGVAPVGPDPPAHHLRGHDHGGQGQRHRDGDDGIDAQHEGRGPGGEQRPSRHPGPGVQEPQEVVDVVAEVADRRTGGGQGRAGLGAAALHLGVQQVEAEQAGHLLPAGGPDHPAPHGRHPPRLRRHQDADEGVDAQARRRGAAERVEHPSQEQADHQQQRVGGGQQDDGGGVQAGPVARHPRGEPPGRHAGCRVRPHAATA